ncbi:MAG TPA: hypothetical protein VJR89_34000 [Polyangiales bacterium]|nr:hypothetical protein [Polyangiales bacterium]
MYSATERWTLLGLVLGALGCAQDAELSGSEADSCFVGDVAKPIEFEVVHRTADGECLATEELGEVPLIQPPQGGKVMFVGVRARNLDGCGLTLATALVEPETGAVISLERRPVTLELGDNGWMSPERPKEASNYSNLPACPRADLTRSITGEPYELRVNITDKEGRKASTSMQVIPTCGEPNRAALCECECSKDYRLGHQCSTNSEASK